MIPFEVEEMVVFENIHIKTLKQKAQKTHKLRFWLSLLKAYDQVNDFESKNATIKQMHLKFILNQQFWERQTKRLLNKDNITQEQVQIAMYSLDDGFYEKPAFIIYKRLQLELQKIVNGQQSSTTLRTNYILIKVEEIVNRFRHRNVNEFLYGLRTMYIKLKNEKKTRQTFLRQIKGAYDNIDVVFDLYKNWEKDEQKIEKGKQLYEEAKLKWQDKRHYLETRNLAMLDVQFSLLQVESIPPFDSTKYIQLISLLPNDIEKLWFLRRICLQTQELMNEYMELMQSTNFYDEKVILQVYKNLTIFPECEMPYLKFLVRKINKHLLQAQNQQYNDKWGNNVVFFRQQIARLIEKERLTPKISQSIRETYYNYWIDVQTALIQDKDTIVNIFQEMLKQKQSVEVYIKYSQCMIRLQKYKEAKNILKKCCGLFKLDFKAQKEYENFIGIYGNMEDHVQLRKMKNLEKQESEQHSQKQQKVDRIKSSAKKQKQQSKQKPRQNRQNIFEEDDSIISLKKSRNIGQQLIKPKKLNIDFQIEQRMEAQQDEKKQNHKQQKNQYTKEQQHIVKHERPNQIKQNDLPKKKMHTDSANTLFIKKIPIEWKEEDVKNILKYKDSIKQIRIIDKSGPQKFCYVDMESQEIAKLQVEENQYKNEYFIALSKPPSAFSELKTLFLYSLPQTTDKNKIKKLFKEYEEHILDIRIILNSNKNIAYVDFDNEENKTSAFSGLKGKQLVIDSKKVLLKECSSQKKKTNKVVFLKNLSYWVKESDIQKFFEGKSIQQIYLPKTQEGKSKGTAFVEFENVQDYEHALNIGTGTFKKRQFYIQKSTKPIERPKNEKNEKKSNSFFSDMFKK